jgi:alkylation response protein AidB-like acyl-CoA dehydrogenase
MGRSAAASPYLHSTIACGLALADDDDPLARAIAEAECVAVLAPSVPGQAAPPVTADALTDSFAAVPWAQLATHVIVQAGQRAFVVEAGNASITKVSHSGLELRATVTCLASRPSGRFDAAFITRIRDNGAAATALLMVGAAARALDVAVGYMRERVQFGKPIGSFQALQHRAADMAIQVEAGRFLAHKAAGAHATPAFSLAASQAKAYASDRALKVCRDAIQLHGGVGVTGDHVVQLFYRLCSDLAVLYGTTGEHRRETARAALSASALRGAVA